MGIKGRSPIKPLTTLPKILPIDKEVHLDDPDDGSDDENYADDKFKDRNHRIGICIFHFKIEEFVLIVQTIVLCLELSQLILHFSVSFVLLETSSIFVSMIFVIQLLQLLSLFNDWYFKL